jgi:hypothetical protein
MAGSSVQFAISTRRSHLKNGEVSEWLKEHAWKACVGVTLPRVRIPPSPPGLSKALSRSGNIENGGFAAISLAEASLLILQSRARSIVPLLHNSMKEGTAPMTIKSFSAFIKQWAICLRFSSCKTVRGDAFGIPGAERRH